eukprot:8842555-Pyramimonas_sp.AAC.1
MIVLDFRAKGWHPPGVELGLRPIFPSTGRQWFLDEYWGRLLLGGKRAAHVAPALAAPARAAQGRATGAVTADHGRGRDA